MTKRRRSDLAVEASRLNQEQLARLGGEIKASRRRRRMTQQELSDLVDIARSTVSAVERGRGGGHTLDTWQRIGVALARPLLVEFAGDELEAPKDGGHLGVQELVIRCAKGSAFRAFFELATRPAEPWRSADVGLRDDRRRLLVLVECWNTIGDVGVAARSSRRKAAEAEQLAVAWGGERPHAVRSCWVVRATRRNRALVVRYPELFASRFPGSSHGWVRALAIGGDPPTEPGLVWCDVEATRLYPWRRRNP